MGQAPHLAISVQKSFSWCSLEHRVYLGVCVRVRQIQAGLLGVVPSCRVGAQSPGGFGGTFFVPSLFLLHPPLAEQPGSAVPALAVGTLGFAIPRQSRSGAGWLFQQRHV